MAHSRRRFVQTLCGGLALAGPAGLLERSALAADISLADRLDLLYSNQFNFDANGEPRITVGLVQGRREVLLSARGGLEALPSGEGGTAIAGGGRWRLRVSKSRPASQRFRVIVDAVPAGDPRRAERAAARWRDRGFEIGEREVGALFGVDGKLLDTRQTLLTSAASSSEADAEAEARRLAESHGILPRLYPEVERRASGRIEAEDLETGVRISAEGVLWFAPRSAETMTVHDLDGEDRRYRGQIYVTIDRRGRLAVVNLVSEGDLLAGLVPAEIYPSSPREALKAQAVAARGHVLAKVGSRHLDDPFLLCAEAHCQVYAGADCEDSRTTAAVRRSAGRVLMRPNGSQLVDTVYSANCGGHSEDNEQVWVGPADPQLRGVADPRLPEDFRGGIDSANLAAWLAATPEAYSRPQARKFASAYRWTATVDPDKVAGNPGVPRGFGCLEAIAIHARGRSGRAIRATLQGSRGRVELHGELRIRRALGGLRSSMFVVEEDRDRHGHLVLRGGGHGHGVGMCQHGAIGMASAGRSYASILAHYYRGSKILRLW